jgi:2-C-methyl-D-erythritol 4-phosphate cytidylyltransferase
VQTPQGFRSAVLREAHDKAQRDGVIATDDAMLVERLGQPVRVVPGLASNVKITTPADLRRARERWR